MKLISCYIENFGKLNNQSYEFNEGINSICEENGWGKSTLATFIRVMFYGFLNEKSRNGITNERKRYKPWQGGGYGGKITFETYGRIYEIERTFGIKENEDEFVLRDKKTNLVCNDYTKNIGEELFKIDVNSFMRTVYISQNDCAATATAGINAKIGNLAENTDDINNYDTAAKRLTDLLNSMNPSRKTGSLYRLKDEIAALQYEVGNISEIERRIEEYTLMRDKKKIEQEDLKYHQIKLVNDRKKISRLNDTRIIHERYQNICDEYSKKKSKVEYLKSLFGGNIPDMKEVDECIEKNAKLSSYENAVKIYELSKEEKDRFTRLNHIFDYGENMPDKKETDDILDKISQMQQMNIDKQKVSMNPEEEAKLQKLSIHFGNDIPDESEVDFHINQYMTCHEKKNSLEARKAALHSMKSSLERESLNEKRRINELMKEKEFVKNKINEKKTYLSSLKSEVETEKKKLFGLFGLGIIFVILGIIIALILKNGIVAIGACAVGAFFFLLMYFCTNTKNSLVREISNAKSEIKELLEDVKGINENEQGKKYKSECKINEKDNNISDDSITISNIKQIENEIIEDELYIRKTEKEIVGFVERYDSGNIALNGNNHIIKMLYMMKSDINQYEILLAKKAAIKNSHYDSQINNLSDEIKEFIARFYDITVLSALQYEKAVHSIEKDKEDFIMLHSKCRNLKKAKQEYALTLNKVEEFLSKLSLKVKDSRSSAIQLMEMKGNLNRYTEGCQELNHICKEKTDYEKAHREDLIRFEEEKESFTTNMQSIDEKIANLAQEMEQIQKSIAHYNGKINELRERFDELNEKRDVLKILEEKYQSNFRKYHLLNQTKKLLEKSKNSFTAKYMQPIMSGFLKYYRIIDGGETGGIHIDAQSNITVDEKGMQREITTLSTGRQDLLGICMRMALISAMYANEKPVVIFDDPFVNLDDARVEGAIELLENIAKEYQVIYFTCHESRYSKVIKNESVKI